MPFTERPGGYVEGVWPSLRGDDCAFGDPRVLWSSAAVWGVTNLEFTERVPGCEGEANTFDLVFFRQRRGVQCTVKPAGGGGEVGRDTRVTSFCSQTKPH